MKLIKILFLSSTIFLSGALSSCSDDDSEKAGIAVETFEAISNFDLSARSNWILYFGGKEYNYTIDGNTLMGTSPKDKPFRFDYGVERGDAQLHLRPRNYGKARSESVIPIIEDQSTIEKFVNCDPLRATYSGKISEDLSGINIYHYNSLLTFRIDNLPEESRVYVTMKNHYNQKIIPLQDANDKASYKAIVLPDNPITNIFLSVETDSKKYSVALDAPEPRANMPYPSGIGSSAIISFTAQINAKDELIIEDLERKPYSKEWPISQ